jgi:hypothetical protein
MAQFLSRRRLMVDDLGDSLDRSLESFGAAGGSAQDQGTLERGHEQVGQGDGAAGRNSPCLELARQRVGPVCRQGDHLLDLIVGQDDGFAGQFLLAAGKVEVR